MKRLRQIKIKNKIFVIAAQILAFSILLTMLVPQIKTTETKAAYTSDTLEVLVGYSGMQYSQYVSLDKFTWQDFESGIIPMNTVSYSYFQGDGETVSGSYYLNNNQDDYRTSNYIYNSTAYRSIVATGYGFYIKDLLDYCNIYYDDIYNICFWVNDAEAIWTALDKNALFKQRYYFNNLPSHRITVYNDFYSKIGYDFSACWEDYHEVSPMLALESNWDSANENAESHEATEEGMSTSMRFRLLYGQTEPTERITRESAEYVSRVYVTLYGQPTVSDEIKVPDDDSKIGGEYEAELYVSDIYNKDITAIIDQIVQVYANEGVVDIERDKIRVETIDGYSDVARIIVPYIRVAEGDAGWTYTLGATTSEYRAANPGVSNSLTASNSNDETETTEETSESEASKNENTTDGTGNSSSDSNGSSISGSDKGDTDSGVEEISDDIESITGSSGIYKLADGIFATGENVIDTRHSTTTEDVDKLEVDDTDAVESGVKTVILIWTGVGCVVLCAIGFLVGLISFKLKLKYMPGALLKAFLHKINIKLKTFFWGDYFKEDK